MTQKDKIRAANMLALRVKFIANSIESEGDDYDMQWHKGYVKQLINACDDILKKLK